VGTEGGSIEVDKMSDIHIILMESNRGVFRGPLLRPLKIIF